VPHRRCPSLCTPEHGLPPQRERLTTPRNSPSNRLFAAGDGPCSRPPGRAADLKVVSLGFPKHLSVSSLTPSHCPFGQFEVVFALRVRAFPGHTSHGTNWPLPIVVWPNGGRTSSRAMPSSCALGAGGGECGHGLRPLGNGAKRGSPRGSRLVESPHGESIQPVARGVLAVWHRPVPYRPGPAPAGPADWPSVSTGDTPTRCRLGTPEPESTVNFGGPKTIGTPRHHHHL
jgi:hypothetical protein